MPKFARNELILYGALALAAVVGFYIVTRPGVAFGLGRGVVGGAAGAVGGAAAGAVVDVGEAIGIPATDEQKCTAAIAAGDTWRASLDCPAGRFIDYLRGRDAVQLARSGDAQSKIAEVLERGDGAQVPGIF